MRAATKEIPARMAQREQRVAMASRGPKVSRDTPAIPAQRAPLDTAAQEALVPKVPKARKVPKAQKAPKGFKVALVKLE